jgi:hypothetical protein
VEANDDCPVHCRQVKSMLQFMISHFLPPAVALVIFGELGTHVMTETFPPNIMNHMDDDFITTVLGIWFQIKETYMTKTNF